MCIRDRIPIAVLGLLLEDWIDTEFRSLWITATMLIVFGVLLALADRLGRQTKPLESSPCGTASSTAWPRPSR